MNQSLWFKFLFCFAIVAVFTSQTAVDLSDALIVLTALFVGIKNNEWKLIFKQFKPAWIWPVWILVLLIGMILNVGFQDLKSWNDFFEFRWILTFLCLIYLSSKIEINAQFVESVAWVMLILNAVAIILYIQDTNWRVQGIIEATMAFSHNIAPLFCFFTVYTLSFWKDMNSRNKLLLLIVAVSSGLLTLFTFTRGVWIGSILGISIALFCWDKKRAIILVGIGMLLSFGILESNKRISDRAFGKTNNEKQSNGERIALWRGNWEIIQDYPVFGVGIGQNKKHLRKYYDEMGYPEGQRESHAHNQYLQMWGGTGILGLILFLMFNGLIYQKTKISLSFLKDSSKAIQLGLFSALLCFMIGAGTESNFNIAKNRLLFLLIAAVAVSQAIKEKQKV